MAQFDVYDNPNAESRRFVPYLVDVQSALISQLTTRLVMPLSRVGAQQPKLPTNLCPVFDIGGESLLLMPHLAAPVPERLLRKPVGSLSHRAAEFTGAFDAVLSGF
jgi:toxin CcdB